MGELLYFYSAAAQISFVLLGFWWAILTYKWDDWMNDAQRRRLGYCVSLHFTLPGIMSLVSIVSVGTRAVWRIGFGLGGALGVVSAIGVLSVTRRGAGENMATSASWLALAALNVAVVLVSVFASALSDGSGIDAIQIEAFLTASLLLVSVQLAWWLFIEGRRQPTRP